MAAMAAAAAAGVAAAAFAAPASSSLALPTDALVSVARQHCATLALQQQALAAAYAPTAGAAAAAAADTAPPVVLPPVLDASGVVSALSRGTAPSPFVVVGASDPALSGFEHAAVQLWRWLLGNNYMTLRSKLPGLLADGSKPAAVPAAAAAAAAGSSGGGGSGDVLSDALRLMHALGSAAVQRLVPALAEEDTDAAPVATAPTAMTVDAKTPSAAPARTPPRPVAAAAAAAESAGAGSGSDSGADSGDDDEPASAGVTATANGVPGTPQSAGGSGGSGKRQSSARKRFLEKKQKAKAKAKRRAAEQTAAATGTKLPGAAASASASASATGATSGPNRQAVRREPAQKVSVLQGLVCDAVATLLGAAPLKPNGAGAHAGSMRGGRGGAASTPRGGGGGARAGAAVVGRGGSSDGTSAALTAGAVTATAPKPTPAHHDLLLRVGGGLSPECFSRCLRVYAVPFTPLQLVEGYARVLLQDGRVKEVAAFVRAHDLYAHFSVDSIILPLVRDGKFDLALNYVDGHRDLYAPVIRLVGVAAHHPALALKYIARFGLRVSDFPDVVVESQRKVLKWMIANAKTLEFAEPITDAEPLLQPWLVAELVRHNQILAAVHFCARYGLAVRDHPAAVPVAARSGQPLVAAAAAAAAEAGAIAPAAAAAVAAASSASSSAPSSTPPSAGGYIAACIGPRPTYRLGQRSDFAALMAEYSANPARYADPQPDLSQYLALPIPGGTHMIGSGGNGGDSDDAAVAASIAFAHGVLSHATTQLVGVDAEFTPQFVTPGSDAALLQLGTRSTVLLFDLLAYSPAMDAVLSAFFTSSRVIKVGYGLPNDLKNLRGAFPKSVAFLKAASVLELSELEKSGAIDLIADALEPSPAATMAAAKKLPAPVALPSIAGVSAACDVKRLGDGDAKRMGSQPKSEPEPEPEPEPMADDDGDDDNSDGAESVAASASASDAQKQRKGLSRLAHVCLGKALNKQQQMSNWSRRPLTDAQQTYAALDAFCLPPIYDVIANTLTTLAATAAATSAAATATTSGAPGRANPKAAAAAAVLAKPLSAYLMDINALRDPHQPPAQAAVAAAKAAQQLKTPTKPPQQQQQQQQPLQPQPGPGDAVDGADTAMGKKQARRMRKAEKQQQRLAGVITTTTTAAPDAIVAAVAAAPSFPVPSS